MFTESEEMKISVKEGKPICRTGGEYTMRNSFQGGPVFEGGGT
jgi:hypothetical protein